MKKIFNQINEDSESKNEYYTKEEIIKLDKLHHLTENKFTDEEIYEFMLKYKDDEELIMNELSYLLKMRLKSEEYNWKEVIKISNKKIIPK